MGRYFAMRVMHSNKNLKFDGVAINRPFENLYNCVHFLEFFNHQNDLKVQHHIISVCHNRTVPIRPVHSKGNSIFQSAHNSRDISLASLDLAIQ